jgi:CubicO group peptidase (beta-lactamase class C family)
MGLYQLSAHNGVVRWGFLGILFLLCITAACQTRKPAAVDTTIATIIEDVLQESRITSVSVAVGRGGRVIFARGFGVADLATGRKLDAGAIMDIGSITKQFTAAAVLKLVEDRRIDLDQPLARYLPSWRDNGRAITIRQLLNHTSGLGDAPFSEETPEPRFLAPISFEGLLAHARTAPVLFAREETWFYSNTGYVLLGLLLERLHEKSYGRVIEEVIARPLGLDTLIYCDKARPIANRVRDYVVRDDKVEPIPPVDVSWFGGAGSLCASATDLVRWEQALLGGKIIAPKMFEAMHTPAILRIGDVTMPVDYGFGRVLGAHHGHRMVSHTGSGAGITAMLSHYPDDDLILAVLVNTNGGGVPDAQAIEARLSADLLGFTPDPETPPDAPVTPAQATAWAGTYLGSGPLEIHVTGCDEGGLCSAQVGAPGPPWRLRHRGNGVFATPFGSGSEIRFVPASGQAQWFVHTLDGTQYGVFRRTNATAVQK